MIMIRTPRRLTMPANVCRWLVVVSAAIPMAPAPGQEHAHLVRGRVVDAVTAAPLAGAEVFVLGIARPRVTDSGGNFAHRRLAPGSYLIQVRLSGWVTMTWEVLAVSDTALVHEFPLLSRDDGATVFHPPSGRAGQAVIGGRVIDEATRAPISGVEVAVVGRPVAATTDGAGTFRLVGLAPQVHMLHVRKIGYMAVMVELTATGDAVEHDLTLQRTDLPLMDTVVVQGAPAPPTSYWHPDFERRRSDGRGQFVTREEIDKRNAYSLGDLLRTLNGLRMNCRLGGCAVWMTRANCRPSYYSDGFPTEAAAVERMSVNDVFGIEVYDLFEVPVELQQARLRCGVIAVWTRRGPPPPGR